MDKVWKQQCRFLTLTQLWTKSGNSRTVFTCLTLTQLWTKSENSRTVFTCVWHWHSYRLSQETAGPFSPVSKIERPNHEMTSKSQKGHSLNGLYTLGWREDATFLAPLNRCDTEGYPCLDIVVTLLRQFLPKPGQIRPSFNASRKRLRSSKVSLAKTSIGENHVARYVLRCFIYFLLI